MSSFTPNSVSFGFGEVVSQDLLVELQSIVTERPGALDSSLLPNVICIVIDPTVSHIGLPLESCQAFEQTFGIQWDPLSEFYLVNDTLHSSLVSQNISITFQLGTVTTPDQTIAITLPYASFDLQVTTDYTSVTNATRYFPLRRASSQDQCTLGRAFLQEA